MRRQRVVRQRLPVGQRTHRERGIEIADLVDQALCIQRIGRYRDDQPLRSTSLRGKLAKQPGIAGAGRSREGKTSPCGR